MLTKKRTILLGTGAILLLIVASAINGYRHTVDETAVDFNRFQLALVRTVALSVHARLEVMVSDLKQLNNRPPIQYLDQPFMSDRLLKFVRESPRSLVKEAFRVDASGREVAKVRGDGEGPAHRRLWSEKEMFDWARQLSHRGHARFGDVRSIPGGGQEVLLIMPTYEETTGTSHRKATNRFAGVTGLVIDVDRMLQLYVSTTEKAAPASFICVVDGAHRFLLHTRVPSMVGKGVLEGVDPESREGRFLTRATEEPEGTAEGFSPDRTGRGKPSEEVVAWSSAEVENLNWRIKLHTAHSTVVAKARHAFAMQLWTVVFLILTVGGGAWLMLRSERLEIAARDRDLAQRRESELRFLVDRIPAILWSVDTDLKITSILGAGLAPLGVKPNETVGMSLYDYMQTRDPANPALSAAARALKGEKVSYEMEWQGHPFQSFVEPLHDWTGKIVGCLGLSLDFSERKKIEETLRRSEERFRIIVENALDPVMIVNRDGTIRYASRMVEEVLGYSLDEYLGQSAFEFMHPDDLGASVSEFTHSVEHPEETRHFTNRIRRKDGSWRTVEATGKNLLGDPAIAGIVVNFRDVTDQRKAEETAQAAQKQLLSILDTFDAIIWSQSPWDRKFLYVSPAAERILGHPIAPILENTRSYLDVVLPEDRDRVDFGTEIMEKGKSDTEYRIRRPDGEIRWLRSRGWVVKDEKGSVVRLDGITSDITQRKRAEEALQREKTYLQGILDNSMDLIFTVRRDGTFGYFNPRLEDVTGYRQQDLTGRSFMEFIPEHRKAFMLERWEEINRGISGRYETEIIRADRTLMQCRISHSVLPGFDEFLVALQDVTEQKMAVEARKESVALFGSLVENMQAGVLVESEQRKIFVVNQAFCNMFSVPVSPDRLIGADCKEAAVRDKDQFAEGETLVQRIDEIVERREGVIGEEVRMADGRVFERDYIPIVTDHQKFIAHLWQYRDVTERKRAEAERIRVSKMESIGLLSGGIAHDFNNILTGILANVSVAKKEGKADTELFAAMADAEKAALRARQLTQQLLTLSLGGAPVKKTVDLAPLVRDAADLAVKGTRVKCEFALPEDLWPVEADTVQLSQAVANLVINAWQAMPQGGVAEIKAENVYVGPGHVLPLKSGQYVVVTIGDHGPGIPPQNLQKIFEPYYSTKPRGSGLGLTVAHSIVARHLGYLAVDSKVGVGTTVAVYLPASEGRVIPALEEKMEVAMGEGRVLVVDDDEHVLIAAERLLKKLGYTVEVVQDAESGIDVYRRAMEAGLRFDLVMMDLTIPGGMGGKEAVAELLKIDPEARVVCASGYSSDPVMSDFRRYGFLGCLPKPFRIQELSRVLGEVLAQRLRPSS
ncbi:MAG: PAS domain S-box protein [Nitrospirae bacterium]|nr:PAS domain S-box protein [Nitrospirota bacterium]